MGIELNLNCVDYWEEEALFQNKRETINLNAKISSFHYLINQEKISKLVR